MDERRWRATWAAVGAVALVAFLLWVLSASEWDALLVLQYAVAGVGPGSAAAIVGVGLALTYQTTGVFNFAFGSIAAFCAYVMWQLAVPWSVPVWISALIAVVLVGPLLGMTMERLVFRPLQIRAASTSEKLLATIAVFALVLGVTVVIWGLGTKLNAPLLFGASAIRIGGDRFAIASGTVGQFVVILICALGVTFLLRRTTLGTQIRAVVDKRELAELAGVRANRVAAISWALGGGFAALAGVLYAPQQGLSPYGLTLLILQTFSVAVIARLTNLLLAVVGGIAVGMIQSMLVRVQPDIVEWWPGAQQVVPYLFVLALPLFLLIWRDLDEVGSGSSATGIVSGSLGRRRDRRAFIPGVLLTGGVLLALGFTAGATTMSLLQQMLALSVVFLSIVAITGFSGHITLGQAAFAGLGAMLTIKITNGALPYFPQLNMILAMLVSAVLVTLLGVATGYPALRRRGLILGLTTLAVNLIVYFYVLQNAYFLEGTRFFGRPTIFGFSLAGDRAFYVYELVVLGLALLLTGSLRSGRLGRVLAAMRDSEAGASSVGLSLRRYKLFIFAASAFLASIGGSLLAQQAQTFNQESWSPLISLFWFLAVVFAGLSYLSGAVVGAVIYIGLDHVAGRSNGSVVIIGFLTLLTVGFLRGGAVGWIASRGRRTGGTALRGLREQYAAAAGAPVPTAPAPTRPTAPPELLPSAYAQRLLEGARR